MKNIYDAIEQGKKDFKNRLPNDPITEDQFIYYSVTKFIWEMFHNLDPNDFKKDADIALFKFMAQLGIIKLIGHQEEYDEEKVSEGDAA
jgi:hypothetical protein